MEETPQSAVADSNEAGTPSTSDSPLDAVTAERDALVLEKAELQDRLLRMQAEFENFRKRTERERLEFAEYAGERTIRELLPAIDDLERALKAAREAGNADQEFVKGFELIYNRLTESLKKQGLEPIITEGALFDPHIHQAIQRVETQDQPDGTILQEYQRGYNFKGRLLRPAMVQVAVRS